MAARLGDVAGIAPDIYVAASLDPDVTLNPGRTNNG